MRKLLLILLVLNLALSYGQSPGGVSTSLTFWLKANEEAYSDAGSTLCTDGDNIAQWNDQTANGNNAVDAGADPIWRSSFNSYNPTADYSTIGGGFEIADDANINSGSATAKTIAVVFTTGASVSGADQQMIFELGGHTDGMNIYIYQGNLYCNLIDNGADNANSTSVSTNTSYVLVWAWNGGTGRWDAYLNGTLSFSDASAPSSYPGDGNNIGLGRIRGRTQYHNDGNANEVDDFEGQIHEIAFYHNKAFSTSEVADITSYMGIKYGITLEQDYNFASGGSEFWNETTNSDYHYDVAGWIRDDGSGLYQNQAISSGSDAIVSVANTSLAADNQSNGNTISSDEGYFLWGNDDDALTFSETGAPADRQILARKWIIEESGSGNVEISVPDNSSSAATVLPNAEGTIYLLADTDTNFSSGATEITMTLNGTEWEATTNLSSFTYFTFATELPSGPGAITSNLTFWFKADSSAWNDDGATNLATDGQSIARWSDLSGNGNDATDNGADPIWREVYNSYNPTVDYSTIAGGLGIGDDADINTGSATQKTIAVAFTTDDVSGATQQTIYEQGDHRDNITIYIVNDALYCNFVSNNANNSNSITVTNNTSYVLIFVYDGDNTRWDAYLNGTLAFSDATAPSSWPGDADNIGLGRVRGSVQYHNDGNATEVDTYGGQIHEMTYYHNKAFNTDEVRAMSTYMALKYGISISGDYEGSGNAPTVWDASSNSDYDNEVTGIGRDDQSAMEQKQSLAADSQGMVSIAISALATSNASNSNSFSNDDEFVMWGNDNGSIVSFDTSGAPSNREIIDRTWKLQITGTPGNVEIIVPDNSSSSSNKLPAEESTIYLLLDTDTNFSSGATEVAMALNGDNWEATTSVNSYTYFTFATKTPAPPFGPGGIGGVDGSSALSLWLDAESISGVSDGANISTWTDQSGNGYDASVENNAPSYSATGGGNGRPAVTFDEANQESLVVTGNSEILPTNEITVFVVGNYEDQSDAWAAFLFAADDDDWDDGWGMAEENNDGDLNMWVDDYQDGGCQQAIDPDYGVDEVWTLIFNTTDNFTYGYKSENTPCTDGFNGPINYDTGGNDNLLIGVARTPVYLEGDIEEIIVYDEAVNDAQRIIISNYLAAKYDISLNNNDVYVQDDNANGDYDYEVAGIGRVDASNLHEDAQGSGILRILNPSDLDDDEFLIWGHDNGDAVGSQTTSDVNSSIDARLKRVWRVSEADASGSAVDVDSIDIRFDLTGFGNITASDLRLVVDLNNNNDFTDDVPISGASDLGSNIYEFSRVTAIDDNYRFTVGTADALQTPLTEPVGPGGVYTDLNLWLRSDQNTSTTTNNTSLTTWSDITPEGNDGTSDGNPPTYMDNLTDNFNFYPTVEFDGSNDRLVIDLQAIKSGAGNGDYTMIAVGERDDATRNIVLGSEGGVNDEDLHFGYRDATRATLAHWGNDLNVTVPSWDAVAVSPFLLGGWYDGSNRIVEEFRNGGFNSESDVNTTDLSGNKTSYLGDLELRENFDGRITEVAVFDNDLSELDKLKVYSYFILKYGLNYTDDNNDNGTPNETISGSVTEGDLVASDGTTILWDYSVMGATYFNDIAGIGYDTLSSLDHKQSKSVASDAVVTIGLGSIASSNLTNANNFSSHLDFLLWGNNNDTLGGVSTNADIPAQSSIADALQRIWKIVETGSVGTVQVAMNKDSIDSYLSAFTQGELYLRIADDAGLTTNVTDVALTETTINGVLTYECDYDFDGTRYFTVVRKGFIVWNGTEWRGGLSVITDHNPSDEDGDSTKPMYILSGDTAVITEAVVVDSVDIANSAVLRIDPLNCLRTDDITSSGDMIIEADATGFGQYKGPAVGAIIKQYVDNDGWHLIGSPFSDATWADLSFESTSTVLNHPEGGTSLDSCNYCNLWWYDGATDNGADIGFMASTAYGTWRTSATSAESFVPTKGWNMYFDANQNFGSAPWTIIFSGTVNDGAVVQQINENNSGWNLVANPYPTVLDWDVIDDDLISDGIAIGYHIWDHANTNFAVYSGGSGTLGATQYIAPVQGFYVQTATAGAQNSGDVFRNFNLDNNDRPNPCQNAGGNIFKSSIVEKDEIKLRTTHIKSGKIDEVVIQLYDGALRNYSPAQDIRKLLTNFEDVPSVYARKGSSFTTITGMPTPYEQDSIPIGIYTADGSQVKIEAVEVPFGYSLFLEDVVTGRWYSLEEAHSFEQMAKYPHRFVLHYSAGDIQTRDWSVRNPFDLYIDQDGMLVIKSLKRMDNVDWFMYDLSGKVVAGGNLSALNGTTDRINIGNLNTGVYIFSLLEGDRRYTEKLPKF